MKNNSIFIKIFCFVLVTFSLFTLCACNDTKMFIEKSNGNIITPSGIEYTFVAPEGILRYLGEMEFEGHVIGEEKTLQHMGLSTKTGMYSIQNSNNDNILIRIMPDNEWYSIYRKASLPPVDFSVDNCSRLELVMNSDGYLQNDAVHIDCGDVIINADEISAFLSDVRSQKSPQEAGLYDLVRKPDGTFENCYISAVIYGFFENEPNLAVCMRVTSYNDLAYSISINNQKYVLTENLISRFQK